MIRVALHLNDPTQRLMLHAVLERANCIVGNHQPDVAIYDNVEVAVRESDTTPTLVVTSLGDVTHAIEAMTRGVWGYIIVPFQPGEAALMVNRAANTGRSDTPFEPRPLADIESDHIQAVLRHCNGNRSRAAHLLRIGRNTLWRKLKAIEDATERPNDDNE